ncbi:alpha/beta fold hydrolase [Psychromicrobium xiongbiense]|uniref:alpha/beta fold hydrolase n=1 Tax=Psychromicrobium xiongbiense TaxID=3051184 RepID=UPI0025574B4A|nr:hypothetical protein [Psychromicrobium sp. YIM S02556]
MEASTPTRTGFTSIESQQRHDRAYQRALNALMPKGFAPSDLSTSAGTVRYYEGPAGGNPTRRVRRTVVLLGGVASPAFSWFRVIPALALEHRVIVIDTLGEAGASRPHPGHQGSLWLDAVLRQLNPAPRRFHLLASGSAASTAVTFAHRNPGVRRLTLVEPWFADSHPRLLTLRQWGHAVRTLLRELLPGTGHHSSEPAVLAGYRRAAIGFRRADAGSSLTVAELTTLSMPVRVLLAADAGPMPRARGRADWLEQAERAAPQAQWELIPHVGKDLAQEAPNVLTAAVLRG